LIRLCLASRTKLFFLVEVDASVGSAVLGGLLHGSFEHVVVVLVGGVGRIGLRQTEQRDQFGEERDVVRPLLAAFTALPARDELIDR
jgi:hypothetical protein